MTNEELSQKILKDIEYIKDNFETLQMKFADHKISNDILNQIQSALNYFRTSDFSFLSNMTNQENLLKLENLFLPYKTSMKAFIEVPVSLRLDSFIANNAKMYEYIERINSAAKEHFLSAKSENTYNEFQELNDRLQNLENRPNSIEYDIEINILKKELDKITESISNLQSSDAQIEITKILTQANQLFEKARDSEQLVSNEIKELKNAKEGHIAYKLSEELQHKASFLKEEAEKKIGKTSFKPLEWSGFYGSIIILFLVNAISWAIYFSYGLNILEFWHFMMLKLTINIPLIFYTIFTLNEYTKAKKLYEEFDYKRIMAQTLMNNYNQFKQDFTDDQDKLLDLIKLPLEKIFDNPVHSIYGDKSGDKNAGIDQLEKIISIIGKIKSKD